MRIWKELNENLEGIEGEFRKTEDPLFVEVLGMYFCMELWTHCMEL
jgi:hypothetical protein